jgi:adenylate cyclase
LFLVAAGALYLRDPNAPLSFLDDLRGRWLPDKASVAVMPFATLNDSKDKHLAKGVTEDVITALSKFPDVAVKSRMSSFNYATAAAAGDPSTSGDIVRDLNVRYVLNASIATSSDKVRVSAELVDASTGQVRWADKFDRPLSEIFEIRDEITRTIVSQLGGLQGEFVREELDRVKRKDPNTFTAYDYVLQGWSKWYDFSRESNEEARGLFDLARKIDPNYARAYAGLAWTYTLDHDFGWTDDYKQAVQKATEYATKAVELDAKDYQSHWALGWAQLHNRQYEKAIASYERARALNPHDPEVLAEMANLTICLGQPDKAVEQLQEAIRLTPYHDLWYTEYLGWAYEEAGKPEKAIETLEQVVNLAEPDEAQRWVMPTLAAAYAEVGRMADAEKVVKIIDSFELPSSISFFLARTPYRSDEQAERFKNAVRKAGLSE